MPLKKQNETVTTIFRAICTDGDYKGKWRDTKQEAIADAKKHMAANPTHEVEIEFEQSGKMIFS